MVSGSRASGKWQTVKRQLEAGLIGRVHQINCAVSLYRRWFWEANDIPTEIFELIDELGLPRAFYGDWQGWHRDPAQMGGGAFVDLGIYWLDILLWLAGAPAVEVVAFTKNAGLPVESFVNVQARLANDVLVSMTFADAVPQGIQSGDQHLMIVGEQGVLTEVAEGTVWLHRDNQRRKLEVEVPDTTILPWAAPLLKRSWTASPISLRRMRVPMPSSSSKRRTVRRQRAASFRLNTGKGQINV
jgi:predicted dehydrogenase